MDVTVRGDDADPDLLWVMGWGNRADSRHESWFVDRLVDAGYRVHAVELPTNPTDVSDAWVGPVAAYRADLEDHVVVGHSAGGLTATLLAVDTRRVLLAPWWGIPPGQPALLHLLVRLPTSARVVPVDQDPSMLGDLATEEDLTGPDRVSPAFVRAVQRAQAALPPLADEDVVFCSLCDEVVSVRAVGRHADAEQVRLYDGGHELFASGGREAYADRVVAAVDEWY